VESPAAAGRQLRVVSEERLARRRLLTCLALALIVTFPLSLFLLLRAHFGADYDTHFWFVGYIAAYMRLHHHPPNVIQTGEYLGIAYPLFYATILYRIIGFISALSDTDIAIRVVIFAATIVQVLAGYRAVRALHGGRGLALLACAAISFSTYQLTNLYNRGDLAEFLGASFMFTALFAWFWSLARLSGLELWLARSIMMASLTIMCGTHSITTVLGGLTFGFVSGVTLLLDHRRSNLVSCALAALSFGCGALLIGVEYVLVTRNLHLASGPYPLGFALYSDRIDSPIARFSPIPLDPASLINGVVAVSTPYLEASIDYALLIFVVGVLIFRRSAAAMLFVISGLVLAVLSVWPRFWEIAPAPLHFMQFPYRLTNVENALTLSAALTVIWRLPQQTRRVARSPLPWIAVTLATFACGTKLIHGYSVYHTWPPVTIDFTNNFLPRAFDYTLIPQTGPTVPPHAAPPAATFRAVGEPLAQHYVADPGGYVFTRILALPWNSVIVNGQALPQSKKLAWKDTPYYGFRGKPGLGYDVQTYLTVPLVVECVIRFIEYCVFLELAAALVLGVLLFRREFENRFDSTD
jgi:hypothetical protein